MMAISMAELNQFTQQIAKAIELNDWETLSGILIERQQHLEALLNNDLVTQEDRIQLESVAKSIQAMDNLFIDAVQFKKTELLKQFNAVSQSRKVIRAYEQQMQF
jgi:uncharacterized protein YjgD (DUF1641 family)